MMQLVELCKQRLQGIARSPEQKDDQLQKQWRKRTLAQAVLDASSELDGSSEMQKRPRL